MALSRASVEMVRDVTALSLGQAGHAGALGQVLPDEAVGVFVGPAFPGVIWRGEVERRSGPPFDGGVVVEFGPVVGSDRFEQVTPWADDAQRAGVHGCCGSVGQLADDHQSGLAFDQTKDSILASAAHHRVDVPMTKLLAALH